METIITVERKQGFSRLTVSGAVNEDFYLTFERAVRHVVGVVELDVSQVSSINSQGVSAWTTVMRHFAKVHDVRLVGCSPVFLAHLNMIPLFRTGVVIESVYLPCVCPSCGGLETQLIRVDLGVVRAKSEVKGVCTKCRVRLAPDGGLDDLLAFVHDG